MISNLDGINEWLEYNKNSGELTWRFKDRKYFNSDGAFKSWNTRFKNKPAFTSKDSHGYFVGAIKNYLYRAHRIIWLLETGQLPEFDIDHIDGVRDNNKWDNLRQVIRQDNMKNRSFDSRNTTGIFGVYWYEPYFKWNAKISRKNLGYFNSKEEAIERRKQAEVEYGYHSNHGSKN